MKKLLSLVAMGLMLMGISAYAADDAAEKAAPAPIQGYLADAAAGKAGKVGDVDLTATPEKIVVEALKAAESEAAGYGVFVMDEATKAFVFKAFNAEATALVKSDVLDKTQKTEGVYVEVTGAEKDGVITVEAIKEIEKDAAAKDAAATEEPKKEEAPAEEPKTEEAK